MNRLTHWGLPLTLAAIAACASSDAAHAQSAGKLFKQGRAAEARDDVEGAYECYAKAFQKKPGDESYKISYQRLRLTAAALHVKQGERLRDGGDTTGALTEFLRALEIDPSNELATQDIRITREKIEGEASAPPPETAMAPGERRQLLDLGGPPQLKPISNEPLTIHANQDSKVVYQTIGKTAGINVLFDPDYHSSNIQVDLTNVSLMDALHILGIQSGTFWRPVTQNTIFVAQNTRGKRTELDEEAVQTFYLTNVSQQNDLNDIQTALRNVFTSGAKLYAVPSQNAIIMRGTPDELLLAGKLINDLDKARSEVVVDIAVLEVSRAKLREYGIQLPQTASINFQQSNAITGTNTASASSGNGGASTSTALQLNQLAHINSTNFAVSIGQASLSLLLNDSTTKTIQNPRLRATDGQESQVKIGERLPVATGSYQAGVATAITSSLVNTQFQYLDIGVNIDVTPVVHYDRDVTMKLRIEISSEGANSGVASGLNEPIINQQISQQTIRVREGEATILSGILQKQRTRTLNGYPGLSELPLLKYLFSQVMDNDTDDEIVFLLTPHIVRAADVSPLNLRQLDTGTTNDIQLRHTGSVVGEDEGTQGVPANGNQLPATTSPNLSAPRPQIPGPTNPAQAPPGQIPGQTVTQTQLKNAIAGTQSVASGGIGIASLTLVPSNPTQSVGSTFQQQITLSGGTDVYAVPLQLQYDQTRLQLTNVDVGDLLGRDGQAVALVHRDDGAGGVAISTSRPPGVAGISGSGVVCTLTFQAKAAGDATITIVKPVVRDSKQQTTLASGSQVTVHVK